MGWCGSTSAEEDSEHRVCIGWDLKFRLFFFFLLLNSPNLLHLPEKSEVANLYYCENLHGFVRHLANKQRSR